MEAITSIARSPAPVADRRAPEPAQPSGKNLPAAGNSQPPAPEPIDVQRAVEQIQTYLSSSQRSLQFRIAEDLGRPIMLVTNPETGEVIRQVPGEEVQKMASAIAQGGSGLVDTLV